MITLAVETPGSGGASLALGVLEHDDDAERGDADAGGGSGGGGGPWARGDCCGFLGDGMDSRLRAARSRAFLRSSPDMPSSAVPREAMGAEGAVA